MFDNRHANLWRMRLLLIPFTLVVGALFAASHPDVSVHWDPRDIASTAISFISCATYIYAVWGATRVPTKVRSFLVFGIAYGLLFCCLSPLFEIIQEYNRNDERKLGCTPGDDICQIIRTAQVLGSMTGCIMILEVIMTARLGPLDHSLRKHRYKSAGGNGGYQPGANVVIVRPDHIPVQSPHQVQISVPFQPQVLVPMSPQQSYSHQPQPSLPLHEVIQHHPLPQSSPSTPLSH